MAITKNYMGQLIDTTTGQPAQQAPQAQPQAQAPAQAPAQSQVQGSDLATLLGLLQQGQVAQGQNRLQGQREYFQQTNPLGQVAQSNSRPSGFTPQDSWRQMFPTAPTGAGYFGEQQMGPSSQTPQAAAIAASPAPYQPTPGGLPFQVPGLPTPGPDGNATNFDQMQQENAQLYSPGGWQSFMPQAQPPIAQGPQPQTRPSPKPYRPSWGASASPRPGFGF